MVPADEHVGRLAGKVRIHHVRVAHCIEGLDDPRVLQDPLDLLPARVGVTDRQPRGALRDVQRVRRINDDLVAEVPQAGCASVNLKGSV